MKNAPYLHSLFLAVMISLMAVSCSSNREDLLESVPSDVDGVATIDLLRLCKESDISVEDGQVVLPRELSALRDEIDRDDLRMLGRLSEAVDFSNVVVFGYLKNEDIYATALIKDADKLRTLLEDNDQQMYREHGFEFYTEEDASYATCFVLSSDESQLWIVDGRDDVGRVADFELARKKHNILRYKGVAQALAKDGICNVAFDQNSLRLISRSCWVTANVTLTDNALQATLTAIEPDGSPVEVMAEEPVQTDFLRYMPNNFLLAMAFSFPQGETKNNIIKELGNKMGASEEAKIITDFFKALDGTFAFGIGPKGLAALRNPETPESWQAVFMAHMPQAKVNEYTEMLRNELEGSQQLQNGTYRFTSRNFTLNYGNVDGYLGVGMGLDLVPDKENAFTTTFSGKPYALVAQTPVLGTIVNDPSLKYSIKASMEGSSNSATLTLELVGVDTPLIPTLVSTLPVFFKRFDQQMR